MARVTCKTCHEAKERETSYTKKAKQVNCDDCLAKAKSQHAMSKREHMLVLEKENEELKQKLAKEIKERRHYQEKYENFAEKYCDLCIKVGDLTLHK
jgi:hypothetical protein